MIGFEDLATAFGRNVGVIQAQIEGLSEEDAFVQTHGGNCLNWLLGHIAVHRDKILNTMGEPPVSADLVERYDRGSEPILQSDEGVRTIEELMGRIGLSQQRIAEALTRLGEEGLAAEWGPEDRKSTVGKRVFFLYFHETYHVGQTELMRQLAGKHDHII